MNNLCLPVYRVNVSIHLYMQWLKAHACVKAYKLILFALLMQSNVAS